MTFDSALPAHAPEAQTTVRRRYIDEFFQRWIATVPEGAAVVDVGGTSVRKRGGFDLGRFPIRPFYVNVSADARPHARGDAQRLPLAANVFNAAICGELLEHVWAPPAVLRELARILRPGGCLLATVPFLYRMHPDPKDYGRYTDQYWREALGEAGFVDVIVEPQGGFYSVLADFLRQYLTHHGVRRPWGPVARRLLRAGEAFAWRYDHSPKKGSPFLASYTTGFGLVAYKPR